jgi:hypothetical protein
VAAHEHLNPDQLKGIAEAHGAKYFSNYQDPEKRDRGCCYEYSDHFGEFGNVKGTKIKAYETEQDGEPHAINVVPTSQGPHALDFTYIQFDKTAKMPHIEPLHEYEARFKNRFPKMIEFPPYTPQKGTTEHIYPSMDWKYGDPL